MDSYERWLSNAELWADVCPDLLQRTILRFMIDHLDDRYMYPDGVLDPIEWCAQLVELLRAEYKIERR